MTAEPVPPYDDTVAPTFAEFFTAHYGRVLRLAVRTFGASDAEEIAQETMVRAFECYDRLDRAGDLWPWVAVVARNVGRDLVRSRAKLVPVDDFDEEGLPAARDPEPEPAAVARDDARVLATALARLSEADVAVLRLREFEGLSFAEVGTRLGLRENAARQLHHRARQHLSRQYRRLGGGVPALLLLPAPLRRVFALLRPARTPARRVAAVSVPVAIAIVGTLFSAPFRPAAPPAPRPAGPVAVDPYDVPVAATDVPRPAAAAAAPRPRVVVAPDSPDDGAARRRPGDDDLTEDDGDFTAPGVMSNIVAETFTVSGIAETDDPTHPLPIDPPRL